MFARLPLPRPMRSPPSVATGLFAGRYAIEREIGQGASAIVYLARDTQAGTAVALKILRPELVESRASDRFLREIKRTSALQHPNILPVLDAGDHEGQLYFALPYMEGGSLRELLTREKRLELSRIQEIAKTIAEALDYAHERGLIHRDVKPENILFTGGQACLGDFGIARAIDLSGSGASGTTSRNVVRGTPAYMSPEQAAGSHELDGRSDVFSLACVIYEMTTGMQAYIGPTDESVISQRFVHPPRDLRVYRPNAPPALDAALQKAFATTAADRYRTAGEMVEALDAAMKPVAIRIAPRKSPIGIVALRDRRALGIAAAAGMVALLAVWMNDSSSEQNDGPVTPDTTLVVLLPIEQTEGGDLPWRGEDLLHQGFARWRDVQVIDQFQVADALQQRGRIASNREAAMLTTSLGAGRYVRTSMTRLGEDWSVSASLYDVSASRALYSTQATIGADIASAVAAFARLADSLLLRGTAADSVPVSAPGSRSLPAQQAFSAGQRALDDWDLERADSSFQLATLFDPAFARAHYWLAQVRAWQDKSRNSWGTVAERAITMLHLLDDRERRLTRALVHLSGGEYDAACSVYDTLARRNERDFAAWFGMGQCRMSNRIVRANANSPSGYAFDASAHAAMKAFERAFEILPSVHRGYERGAFTQLRVMLRTTTSIIIGYAAEDSARFYARPAWIADTFAIVPYRWQQAASGDSIPPNFLEALSRRREAFKRLALRWSTAFPRSAGAKYAVAVALETLGDQSAIDTLDIARRLAKDSSQQRRLAAYQVLLLAKFGLPENTVLLARAAALADSLITPSRSPSAEEADLLTQVAMLTGRCRDAERLVLLSPQEAAPEAVKPQVFELSQRLVARAGTGCPVQRVDLATLAGLLDREFDGHQPDARALGFETWLSRALLLSLHYDPELLGQFADESHDPSVTALWAFIRGKGDSARMLLRPSRDTITLPTPDVGYPKAQLELALGDTTAAIARLTRILRSVRSYDPQVLSEYMRTGPLMRSAAALAELSAASGDTATAQRWATAIAILWSNADADVRSAMRRRDAARMH